MSNEQKLDHLFPVGKLLNEWAISFDAPFTVSDRRTDKKGVLLALTEDLHAGGYWDSMNGSEHDGGKAGLDKAIPMFLSRFSGTTLTAICTMLSWHDEYLETEWYFNEGFQRELLLKAAEHDLAIAHTGANKQGALEGITESWKRTEQKLTDFIPKISALKTPTPIEITKR